MIGTSLFRAILAAILVTLPTQSLVAKSPKCSADMPYIGPAPISVVLPKVGSLPTKQAMTNPESLSVLFADMFTKSKATSMTVALADHSGPIWTETQGLEGPEKLHYWASVGKTFTAVVIMQLVEDERLSLDDKLSNWIDGVPNGVLITIKMLLDHSSGLYSTNEDPAVVKNDRGPLSLQDNIKILKKHGPLFCPGQYWRYSNTGYFFLGEIAERIYGQPLPQIIKAQIIDKIGLRNTRMLVVGEDVSDVAKPQPSDDQKSDVRTPGPAGPIAATSADMIQFWRAFLNGELVAQETRDQMLATLYPMFDKSTYYGLGVMAMQAPGPDGKPTIWIGHAGGMPGVKAFVMIDPVSRQYGSVALTGDGPAAAVAHNMLQEWQKSDAP